MTNSQNPPDVRTKAKLFISYSRADSAFTDLLVAELSKTYEVLIDRSGIRKGEDWWKRLEGLIIDCAIMIFIMSPNSVGSPVCKQEIACAHDLKKRIVPVMFRTLASRQAPFGLREPDWVIFEALGREYELCASQWIAAEAARASGRENAEELDRIHAETAARLRDKHVNSALFRQGLAQLDQALRLDDILWLDQQAEWLRRATDWEKARRSPNALLHAVDTDRALDWQSRRPVRERRHELIADYIAASRTKYFDEAIDSAMSAGRFDAALRLIAAEALPSMGPKWEFPDRRVRAIYAAAGRQQLRGVLSGHSGPVRSVIYNGDGSRIVTTSADGSAVIWDVNTRQQLVQLLGHRGAVNSAAFDGDERRLVTSGNDQTAIIWDIATGKALCRLLGHSSIVFSACFSPDGSRVLTASGDGSARIWDASTGRHIKSSHGHGLGPLPKEAIRYYDFLERGHFHNRDRQAVNGAAHSPDGIHVATAGDDRTVQLWDCRRRTSERLALLMGHEHVVNSLAFSTDGRYLVTASDDSTAIKWSVAEKRELYVIRGHEGPVNSASFSADGSRIVTTSDDGTVRVWDALDGSEIKVLNGHEGVVFGAVFSPDGTRIVSQGEEHSVYIWDAAISPEIVALPSAPRSIDTASFSPDGEHIVLPGGNSAHRWDYGSGRVVTSFAGHTGPVTSACFDHEGRRVATASADCTARIWDTQRGRKHLELRGHKSAVNCIVFGPDGDHYVTTSDDRTARSWAISSGEEAAVMVGHDGPVHDIAIGKYGGACFITTSADNTTRAWNTASGKCDGDRQHKEWVVRFVCGDLYFSVSSLGRKARVGPLGEGFQQGSERQSVELIGHDEKVEGGTLNPRTRLVATTSQDRTARLWHQSLGYQLAILKGHRGAVTKAAFDAKGDRLATCGDDQTVRIWDISKAAALVAADYPVAVLVACLSAGQGELTNAERGSPVMRLAPVGLFEALTNHFGEWEHKALQACASSLARPAHRNCYLAPSQRRIPALPNT